MGTARALCRIPALRAGYRFRNSPVSCRLPLRHGAEAGRNLERCLQSRAYLCRPQERQACGLARQDAKTDSCALLLWRERLDHRQRGRADAAVCCNWLLSGGALSGLLPATAGAGHSRPDSCFRSALSQTGGLDHRVAPRPGLVGERQRGRACAALNSMITKRFFVGGTCAVAMFPGLRSFAQSLRPSIVDSNNTTLRTVASARGILYGSAVSSQEFYDADFCDALAREATILVPEYEMKRAIVEPSRGTYVFSGCDRILAFARRCGMQFRGHPLVWHKRNPDWLEAAARGTRDETLISNYIEKIAGHFRGQMHSWDVVNEAIAPEDGRADKLRKSFWLESFG